MVQIGSRRKKTHQRREETLTKPDPDRRAEFISRRDADDVPQRRSTRRRNITYNEDFYDEIFEEEEDEEEEDEDDDDVDEDLDLDVRRKEKKVKSVMKIPDRSYKRVEPLSRTGGGSGRGNGRGRGRGRGTVTVTVTGNRTGQHVSAQESSSSSSSSSSSDDEDNRNTKTNHNNHKPFKKRKISEEDDENMDDDDDNEEDDVRSRNQNKSSKPNGVIKKLDSVQPQGKVSDSSKGVQLPEKHQLEFILDKLQKKDTYGVYAEPVDPEELPDYHDVIEHPMDFGTVRKKLAKGSYTKLEQFESDIDLICTNAMQYNAPETVYFKQARSIQDLARKKFERLKTELQGTVAEFKSEEIIKTEIIKTNSMIKKPIKKPPCKIIPEPVGSDLSSGATLAAAADICTLSHATPTRGYEKPTTVDVHVDGNSSLTESKTEKVEEHISGKGFPSKLGRKTFVLDENRRASYNISKQPVVRTESMCTIFEDEKTQLVSAGVHADHAYARSLARFAATLGPVAWKVASQKIEQALPAGVKFGRGWVGDYEPLPTPVLKIEKCTQKQLHPGFPSKSTNCDKAKTHMMVQACEPRPTPVQMVDTQAQWRPSLPSKSRNDDKAQEDLKVQACELRPTPVQMIKTQTQWQPRNKSQVPAIENQTQVRPGSTPVPVIENQTQVRPGSTPPVPVIESQTQWRPGNSSQVPMIDNQTRWHPGNSSHGKTESPKEKFAEGSKFPKKDVNVGIRTTDSTPLATPSKSQDRGNEPHFTNTFSEGKLGFIGVSGSKSIVNAPHQLQNSPSMNNGRSDNMALKQVQLNHSAPPSVNHQGHGPPKQLERISEVATSRLLDVVSRNQNLVQSVPFKHSDANGFVAGSMPNGKASINASNHQASTLPFSVGSNHQASTLPFSAGANQQARAAMYFPHANQEQGLSDPVQMMKMLAQKTQNQQRPFNFPGMDGGQNTSLDPSPRSNDSNAAATAAARAWMTLGATQFKSPDGPGSPKLHIAASSLYNSGREVPQITIPQNREEAFLSRGQLQSKNNSLPPQMFLPQPNRAGNEVPFQNNRQMGFPQLVTTDLSRFQGQSPWQGLRPHSQPNKKQDCLPPDLNISFQPSPRQSAGGMTDSQQPDLALQL